MGLQPGDILLVYDRTVLDSAIDYISSSPWSHAAMVADPVKGLTVEARPFSTVCNRSIDEYKKKALVMRFPGLSPEQQAGVVQYAINQLGKKYDYVSILEEFLRYGFGIPAKEAADHKRFICSTLVTSAYLSEGIRITEQPLASPGDLFLSKKLAVVGRLGVDM